MSPLSIIIDEEYFKEVCGKCFDAEGNELTETDKSFIFERLMRKSELENEIESYIENFIDYVIDWGLLDEYRKDLAEGRRENDAYEEFRAKQLEGEA